MHKSLQNGPIVQCCIVRTYRMESNAAKDLYDGPGVQGLHSSGKYDDLLLHLSVQLVLRGVGILLDKIGYLQDALFFVGLHLVSSSQPAEHLPGHLHLCDGRQDLLTLRAVRLQPVQQRKLLN